jgi:ribosomal RNA assembly protein
MIDFITLPEERIKLLRKDEKWKEQLKKFSDAKVELNDEVSIESEDPFQVLRLKEVFKAFGRGFDFDTALNLLDEEYFLEIIQIKEFSGKSRKRQVVLKGRVIGTKGKMKKMIEKYCDVKIAIYGKTISIIGKWNNLKKAKKAIEMILGGAMHATVYKFLERE